MNIKLYRSAVGCRWKDIQNFLRAGTVSQVIDPLYAATSFCRRYYTSFNFSLMVRNSLSRIVLPFEFFNLVVASVDDICLDHVFAFLELAQARKITDNSRQDYITQIFHPTLVGELVRASHNQMRRV